MQNIPAIVNSQYGKTHCERHVLLIENKCRTPTSTNQKCTQWHKHETIWKHPPLHQPPGNSNIQTQTDRQNISKWRQRMHTHGRPVKEVEYNLDMERIPHTGLKNTRFTINYAEPQQWTSYYIQRTKVQKSTLNYKMRVMHRLTGIVARAGPPYRPREERCINLHSESIRNQHHTKAAEGGTTRKDKPLE